MAEQTSTPARLYRGLDADARRAERRERLLESGLELLGATGWQATTVTAICEHARLTPRYFYESFRDRDELVVAIFDAAVAEVAAEVQAAVAAEPRSVRGTVRANIAAWVKIAMADPRKARVAFVEALGSDALMRRRLDATRILAQLLTEEARANHDVSARESRALDVAGLAAAGALIETMIEWLEGRLDGSTEEIVEDYTRICTAGLEAALPTRAST